MSTLLGAPVDSSRANAPVLSDTDLMARARRGDRGAYAQVVLRHQDRLFNVLFRLLADPDQAAQLTQETFARALGRVAEFSPDAQPFMFLMRIAVNLGLCAVRQGRPRNSSVSAAESQPAHLPILAALSRLDIDYRVVLVLRDLEGLDFSQISEVIGLPAATVKCRLFRARLALRDQLRV
jgi:RNA polymerase sigma-70 factor (ECF subfamily)